MTDSVEERIVQNVIETVQAVTVANGWDVDVALVQRQEENIDCLPSYPGAIVVHDGTQYDSSRPGGIIMADLSLAIMVGQKNAGATWANTLAQLRDNVIEALFADTYRGTFAGKYNARRTEVQNSFTGDSTRDGKNVTRAEISVSVRFGFETTDLSVAY